MNNRIRYLDGLRGIAILGVLFFHAFSRWGSVETFKQANLFVDSFSFGHLGVNLFFAISGYVIYMSLFKSTNIMMFGFSRYLRLAPAMLLASTIIYLTSFYITERPMGVANIIDLLPSLTFMDPHFLNYVTGLNVRSLDGAFWSIYVEIKFYIIAAILFYLFRDKSLFGLIVLYMCSLVTVILVEIIGIDNTYLILFYKGFRYIGVSYYGWFLIGIWAYKYSSEATIRNFFMVLLFTLVAVLETGDVAMIIASSVTAALFVLPLIFKKIQDVLSSSFLRFFGFISYPLYLVHQNIVTGMAIKLHNYYPDLPGFVYPFPFIILVIIVSYLLVRIEPRIKSIIRSATPNTFLGHKLHRIV